MPLPIYGAADLLTAMQALMPRGRVWSNDPASTQTAVLLGMMPIWEDLHQNAADLLYDAFPSQTTQLLPEWENSLGLPDPCAGVAPTIQQRRAQVVARFTNSGGQSPGYIIAYAASLGFTITITEFTPFRCGQQSCGDPLGTADWANAWAVVAPLVTEIPFRAGASAAGEPLNAFGNAVLQCEIAAIAPAHTIVEFQYH